MPRKTVEDRFWAKVDKRGEDECWLWTGGVANSTSHNPDDKRGLFWNGERNITAPRVAYELYTGQTIPPELHALHTCDVTLCVNPKHIYCGTQTQNMRDRTLRKRYNSVGYRRMREDYVRCVHMLFRCGFNHREIAGLFGVNITAINHIHTGKTWRAIWEEVHGVQTEGLRTAA